MPWVKMDDEYPDHPKVEAAGPLAAWLNVCGWAYASRYLTDGFIPEGRVHRLADVPDAGALATKLVEVDLWERVPSGYRIHDYLKYNPTAEQVRAERDIAARRSAMNANATLASAVKGRDGNHCRYCTRYVSWADRKSPSGATYDHVIPIHAGGTEDVENIVVCCRTCNLKKGARTPEHAGMPLLAAPAANPNGIQTASARNPDNPDPLSSRTRLTPVVHPGDVPAVARAGAHETRGLTDETTVRRKAEDDEDGPGNGGVRPTPYRGPPTPVCWKCSAIEENHAEHPGEVIQGHKGACDFVRPATPIREGANAP